MYGQQENERSQHCLHVSRNNCNTIIFTKRPSNDHPEFIGSNSRFAFYKTVMNPPMNVKRTITAVPIAPEEWNGFQAATAPFPEPPEFPELPDDPDPDPPRVARSIPEVRERLPADCPECTVRRKLASVISL